MGNSALPSKRPIAIIIICFLIFFSTILSFPLFLKAYENLQNISDTHFNQALLSFCYSLVTSIVVLVCMVGFWKMQKWAVYGYSGLTIVNQVISIIIGSWDLFTLLIPLTVIFYGFKHLPKMS